MEKENSSNTLNSSKQFSVLDLLLLILSIAYFCGLIALGQNTSLGSDLIDWAMAHFSSLARFGFLAPAIVPVGSAVLFHTVDKSPQLVPRLFLKMNLVTMFTGLGATAFLLITEQDPVPISTMFAFGAIPFLPLWILHHGMVGNRITYTHAWIVLVALFCNVALITFLMAQGWVPR